ncbi:sensor histidine kinase [Pedobacter punctiformis]|uniref:Histidine kinase n=1 Tax=Pedobacter punctiformis TaxID=3004097 RepID=A0ABT4L883_9SPHI|nr:histidine kinase [Pedobacter sp. HCMS5-2]MCZ4244140.1 histidine kinase [Pedobacter sp. HCMS5-2]
MKLRLLFLGFGLLFFFACKHDNTAENKTLIKQYNAAFKKLADKQSTLESADSILNAWQQYNKNSIVLADTDLNANVKYNLGRVYAKRNVDSAKNFLQQGLELVEQTKGYLDIKARIYNGMGNLANGEASEHQANYYYNKAAIIVLSDSTVNLKPQAKCIILLAAAQSNANLYQYNLAYKMNLAALKLMPQLPPNSVNQQRVLHQLIFVIYTSELPTDNIVKYLKRMEELQTRYPDQFNPRFLYDSKILYFSKRNQVDSILKYSLLNVKIDEETYHNYPTEKTSAGNLYTTYTNLLNNYTKIGDYKAAGSFAKKANEIYKENYKIIAYEELIRNREAISAYFSAIGEPNNALKSSLEALEIQKENFETENTQAVAEMNALYQIQAKDNSIKSLNEDIKLNMLQLERSRLILLVTALIILLLLIFIVLFYSIYKQRKLKQEKENVQLQQQLLRTQMEPHFIFNTLSALQSFIRLDEKDEAIKYLNQFSRLLRSSLELSREKLVPLGQEIEALNNYLSLQQMRYNYVFRFNIQMPEQEDLDTLMIPPMLVQPFVENAILHGVDLSDKNGFISIDFMLEEKTLKVNITDSGKAIVENKTDKHQSLSGMISKERLELLGKERNQEAGIKSDVNLNGGTTVSLNIPVGNLNR